MIVIVPASASAMSPSTAAGRASTHRTGLERRRNPVDDEPGPLQQRREGCRAEVRDVPDRCDPLSGRASARTRRSAPRGRGVSLARRSRPEAWRATRPDPRRARARAGRRRGRRAAPRAPPRSTADEPLPARGLVDFTVVRRVVAEALPHASFDQQREELALATTDLGDDAAHQVVSGNEVLREPIGIVTERGREELLEPRTRACSRPDSSRRRRCGSVRTGCTPRGRDHREGAARRRTGRRPQFCGDHRDVGDLQEAFERLLVAARAAQIGGGPHHRDDLTHRRRVVRGRDRPHRGTPGSWR